MELGFTNCFAVVISINPPLLLLLYKNIQLTLLLQSTVSQLAELATELATELAAKLAAELAAKLAAELAAESSQT